ncbi:MAG: hypothetical protein EON56_05735, partial [Alphaproteobacteria bacterium]
MTHRGFVVPARSKRDIIQLANMVRSSFRGIMQGDRVPVDLVYEILPSVLDRFELEVCDRAEMGNDHGLTYPDRRLIKLRADVYDGMCTGSGRDRFTAAHELGHLLMHGNIGLARSIAPGQQIKLYYD